jgi:hypothetical protein
MLPWKTQAVTSGLICAFQITVLVSRVACGHFDSIYWDTFFGITLVLSHQLMHWVTNQITRCSPIYSAF